MPLLCLRDPSANCAAACAGVKPAKPQYTTSSRSRSFVAKNHNGKIRSLHIPYSQCQTSRHPVSRLDISVSPKSRGNFRYLITVFHPDYAPHDRSHCRIHQGIGGGERDRTDDLLLAKQALSQLSYTPVMVGLRRVELLTSPLSGVRSNQLSYRPGNVSLASLI